MKNFGVSGYKKKSKAQLLKAIDECQSLSQLFALIQHENIVIRMHSQIISKKDTPLERLKAEVRKSVENSVERKIGCTLNEK